VLDSLVLHFLLSSIHLGVVFFISFLCLFLSGLQRWYKLHHANPPELESSRWPFSVAVFALRLKPSIDGEISTSHGPQVVGAERCLDTYSCSQVTVLFYIYSVQKLASFLVIFSFHYHGMVDENLSMSIASESAPGLLEPVGTCDHFWKQSVNIAILCHHEAEFKMLKAAVSSHSILIYHALVTCNFCPICGQKLWKLTHKIDEKKIAHQFSEGQNTPTALVKSP